MQTPDTIIERINSWLAQEGISIFAASKLAGMSENTVAAVLRGGHGRIETLRRLLRIVPDDFQVAPSEVRVEGAEHADAAQQADTCPAETCERAA